MAKTVIKRDDLANYLRDRYTAREIATMAGISTQYAYALQDGSSFPSAGVLDYLGIKILYDVTKAKDKPKKEKVA